MIEVHNECALGVGSLPRCTGTLQVRMPEVFRRFSFDASVKYRRQPVSIYQGGPHLSGLKWLTFHQGHKKWEEMFGLFRSQRKPRRQKFCGNAVEKREERFSRTSSQGDWNCGKNILRIQFSRKTLSQVRWKLGLELVWKRDEVS